MKPALLQSVDARGVATLTLDRPERHNALDDAVIAELTDALLRLGADERVRVIVLTGRGPTFCAGADLGWMRRMADYSFAENLADATALATLSHVLDTMLHPTVALVQGPAYGGGIGLICCCDVALGVDGATFRLSEVRLGLTPATISPYVVRAIGARQARRYFLTAETITSAQARTLGLLHEVVPAAELAAAAAALIEALLAGAPGAQAEAKALVALCEAGAGADRLRDETARRIARRRASPEAQEGIAAFFARRPPAWAVR